MHKVINYIKFKTSYIDERREAFGEIENNNIAAPKNYKRLIKWIKFNKWLYEFMVRIGIIKYVPDILLKIYSRVSGHIFKGLNR